MTISRKKSHKYTAIFADLAPAPTGNQPIEISAPLLWFLDGRFFVVALVFRAERLKADFVKPQRNVGSLIGLVVLPAGRKEGEFVSVATAQAKYGINLRGIRKGTTKDAPDASLPPSYRLPERYLNGWATPEAYNQYIERLAAQDPTHANFYHQFTLDPAIVPSRRRSPRRLITFLIVANFMLVGLICLYAQRSAELAQQVQQLESELVEYGIQNTTISDEKLLEKTIQADEIVTYQTAQLIAADEQNGQIADHTRGAEQSDVILVEYGDFQCPACAAAMPIARRLYEEYGDRVTFVYRNYPLSSHAAARPAAYAAEAAGLQGYYWQMNEALFEKRDQWINETGVRLGQALAQIFASVAPDADQDRFASDYASERAHQKVDFDYSLGTLRDNISYTPSFLLDGEIIDFSSSAQSAQDIFNVVKQRIDNKLQ